MNNNNVIFSPTEETNVALVPFVDGVACSQIIIDDKYGKRITGLVIIKQDLERASDCLALLNPDLEHRVSEALWLSAIGFYSRCFVSGEGRGLTLEKKHLSTLCNHLQDFHKHIIDIRHSYTAHAGKNGFEKVIVSAVLSPDKSNKQVVGIGHGIVRQIGTSAEELKIFQALISEVNSIVDSLYSKATGRLTQELQKQDINQLYIRAIHPPTAT
jgi:hypothetical protein